MADFHVETLDGDLGRVAIVLPGSGYTAEHPLLEYPSRALEDAGWSLADATWDADVAARSGAHVVEVRTADHRLVVPGDWRVSLAVLGRVTEAVEDLAERVAA